MTNYHATVELNGEIVFEDDVVADNAEEAYDFAYSRFLDRANVQVTPAGPGPDCNPED